MRSSNFAMVRRPSSGGQRTEGQCLFVRCCFRKDVGFKQSHFPSGWVGGLPYARTPRSEEATRRGYIRRMWTGSILVNKGAGARPRELVGAAPVPAKCDFIPPLSNCLKFKSPLGLVDFVLVTCALTSIMSNLARPLASELPGPQGPGLSSLAGTAPPAF
jgi:hypothetical protein